MIPRILEPEVMDTQAEAVDYDAMDHGEVNRLFVEEFLALCDLPRSNPAMRILDVGTGTAQIPIELCRRSATGAVLAIDLSREMLKVGRRNVDSAGLSEQIELQFIDAKQLPMGDGAFDAVISNSIVHHIPKPALVFAEMVRVLKPGGVLFVRDLLRPADLGTLDRLVQTYAGDENAHQQQMFRDSLHAALTIEEVQSLLEDQSLPTAWATASSDRHWTIAGRLPIEAE